MRIRWTLLAASAGLCFAAEAAAQSALSTPEARPAQKVVASAADVMRLAKAMAAQGKVAEAKSLLTLLTRDSSPAVRNEARFRLAELLEGENRLSAAALLYRRILDEQPGASAVRLRLARLFQQMGETDSALRELRAVRSANLPIATARFVDRLSASLQATKPFGVQFEIALAPDSNINRATKADTLGTLLGDFTIDDQSKARSGVGLALRGLAQSRIPVAKDVFVVTRLGGDGNFYRRKAFDLASVQLGAGPEWKLGALRLSAEGGAALYWFGLKPFERDVHMSASASHPLSATSQLRLDAAETWSDNHVNDLQDGRGITLALRYEISLSPRLLVGATAGFGRFKARDPAYSTRTWSAGLNLARDIGRTTVSAAIETGTLRADDRLEILPEARRDRWTRLSVGAVFRQLTVHGFAPVARLVVERNRSTVAFYDYCRTRTEFGVSRAF